MPEMINEFVPLIPKQEVNPINKNNSLTLDVNQTTLMFRVYVTWK